jgi:hypothetical protein
MSHLRTRRAPMQLQGDCLEFLVRHRGSLMLSQVFTPRIDPEQFQESFGLLRILVEPPPHGPVAQAVLPELAHDQAKALEVLRGYMVFDTHEDGAVVEIGLKIRMGFRPVGGWRQVDRFVDDEREETSCVRQVQQKEIG